MYLSSRKMSQMFHQPLNMIYQSLNMVPYVEVILNVYLLAVGLSMFYGMYSGFSEWVNWMNNKTRIKLQKKTQWLEPIVNTTRNSGYFVWNVITYAISTTFIAATFLLSVPMLTIFFSETSTTTTTTTKYSDNEESESESKSEPEVVPKKNSRKNRN